MNIDRRAKEMYEMSQANMPGRPSPAWEDLEPPFRDRFAEIARNYEPANEPQPITVKRLKEYLSAFSDQSLIYWSKDDPRPVGGYVAMDQVLLHLGQLKEREGR